MRQMESEHPSLGGMSAGEFSVTKKAPSHGQSQSQRRKSHEPKKTGLTSMQPESRHCRAEWSLAEQVGPTAPDSALFRMGFTEEPRRLRPLFIARLIQYLLRDEKFSRYTPRNHNVLSS